MVKLRAAWVAGRLVRGAPGVVGAVLVCVGLWLAWRPLGVVAAGGFLLLLDWRLVDEPPSAAHRLRVAASDRDRRAG